MKSKISVIILLQDYFALFDNKLQDSKKYILNMI